MARTIADRQAAREARFNQLTVERMFNPVHQAIGHSNSRNSRVAQTLTYFSLMRNSGAHSFVTAAVAIEKAARQHFKSVGGNQAAHYLPGQIRIEQQFPWRFISDTGTAVRLECLFADVENLPSDFNKADSVAEGRGLREAFRIGCEVILREAGPRNPSHANRELVRRVYDDLWVPRATQAFLDAATQKELRANIPDLQYDAEGNITNLEERSALTDEWNFDHQQSILQRYAETMRTAPPDLRDEKMVTIEKEFKP